MRVTLCVCCLAWLSEAFADDGPLSLAGNVLPIQDTKYVVRPAVVPQRSPQAVSSRSRRRRTVRPGLIGPSMGKGTSAPETTSRVGAISAREGFGHSIAVGSSLTDHANPTSAAIQPVAGRLWNPPDSPATDVKHFQSTSEVQSGLLPPVDSGGKRSSSTLRDVSGVIQQVDLGQGASPWSRSEMGNGRVAGADAAAVSQISTIIPRVGGGHSTARVAAKQTRESHIGHQVSGGLPGVGGHSIGVRHPVVGSQDSIGGHSIFVAADRLQPLQGPQPAPKAKDVEGTAETPRRGSDRFRASLNQSVTANKRPQNWFIDRTDGPVSVSPDMAPDPGMNRSSWCAESYQWTASGLYHNPLYFQDRNLERFGHAAGRVQPWLSAASFATDLAAMPVNAILHPWYDSVYSLGYPRPGTPSVEDMHPPQGAFEHLSSGPVEFLSGECRSCVDVLPAKTTAQEAYETPGQ